MNEASQSFVAVIVMGALCSFVGLVGFIGTLIWFLRSRGTTAPAAVVGVPRPVAPAGAFHLSVVTLAFDAYFRSQVEQVLSADVPAGDPVGARVALVRRACESTLGVEPHWRHVGYGEKDFGELTLAQQGYGASLADFRSRVTHAQDGGSLCVLTLILCTRGRRLGVERVETRQQVRGLLEDRARLDASSLLGAEIVWAPVSGALTEQAVRERYPEMHAVTL